MADGHAADGEGLGEQGIGHLGIRADGWNGLGQILQHKAHGDGGDEAGQVIAGLTDGPVGQQLHQHAHAGADDDSGHHGQPSGNPRRHQHGNGEEQGIAAHHDEVAMGEVDELDDAVDHGIAQGDQGVHASQTQPGYQELNECDHGKSSPSRKQIRNRHTLLRR